MHKGDSPNVDLHWEIPVNLIPTVIESDGKEIRRPQYAQAVEEILLDGSAKTVLAKKIGRFFDYDVVKPESTATRDKKVNIVCKVHRQNDMKEFHDSYYDKRLHKILEKYFEETGILASLDVLPTSSKKFQLDIDIDGKVFSEKAKHHRVSLFSAGETSPSKRKSDLDTPCDSEHWFRIHIPDELNKILRVTLHSDTFKKIDGFELKEINGTHLWEVAVEIPQQENVFRYHYIIKCDDSLRIPYLKWKVYKDTKTIITEEFCSAKSSLHLDFASQHAKDGYYSHCRYIVRSVKDGQEIQYMKEMNELRKFSSHVTIVEAKNIITNMIHSMQEEDLMRRGNCVVFVSFLEQNYPRINWHAIMPSDFARKILDQCALAPKECILQREEVYLRVFEMIYISADHDQANLLSFFNCLYPLYDVDVFTKRLSDHNRGTQSVQSVKSLHGDIESAKRVLKAFVKKLILLAEEDEKSKTVHFVEKLQRNLNFDLQIVVCEVLMYEKIPVDTSLGILHSVCERILNDVSKRGDILGVTEEWEKMKRHSFISREKILDKVEKCILESFEKANENQMKKSHAALKEICINGSLFHDTDAKVKLLKKIASSRSREVHFLVAECLLQKRFQEIPEKDVDEIVFSWFECAQKHHCRVGHKRKQLTDFLTNLYAYYSKVVSNPWLSAHIELLEKIEKKTFECLKEEDILDIIEAMPEIETRMEESTEDLFRAHIQALFQEGLSNGDINKQYLFDQTKYCVVNSRVTLQYFVTLMECSGLRLDMGLEDAVSVILCGHHLWKSILTATGKKKDDIHKNKLYMKAKETILDLMQAIEKMPDN